MSGLPSPRACHARVMANDQSSIFHKPESWILEIKQKKLYDEIGKCDSSHLLGYACFVEDFLVVTTS
jgi:hypothetical protein